VLGSLLRFTVQPGYTEKRRGRVNYYLKRNSAFSEMIGPLLRIAAQPREHEMRKGRANLFRKRYNGKGKAK